MTGPQNMPVFNDMNITPEEKADIITYLKYLDEHAVARWSRPRQPRSGVGGTVHLDLRPRRDRRHHDLADRQVELTPRSRHSNGNRKGREWRRPRRHRRQLHAGTTVEKFGDNSPPAGTAVVVSDAIQNPGFPPHRARVTDIDPQTRRQQERRVSTLFYVSIIGSVLAVVAYILFPIVPGDMGSVRLNNLLLGLGIALGLLGIGIGAVHWSKALMDGQDMVELRHATRGTDATRAKAVEVFHLGNKESGFGRRTLIRNTLIGALVGIAAFPPSFCSAISRPRPTRCRCSAHAVGQGRSSDPRPVRHADQGVRCHPRLRLPRHPGGSRTSRRTSSRRRPRPPCC